MSPNKLAGELAVVETIERVECKPVKIGHVIPSFVANTDRAGNAGKGLVDDVSRDEPFIEQVNGKDFVVVLYTLRHNGILLIEGRNYSSGDFLKQITMDLDQLWKEAGQRRRMLSVSAQDRISGSPQMVRAWDECLRYAKSKPGVTFMRKDEIARFMLESPLSLPERETI